MSKNTLKKNCLNIKDYPLDDFIKTNILKKNKNYFLKLLKMFRTKKGINNNDQLSKIASNFFNTNESSTDECSN